MNKADLIAAVEKTSMKDEPPTFEIGDIVDVHVRIIEGEKERVQIFNGTVIARRGRGTGATFTVRRIVQGEGVERTFPVHGPRVVKVDIKRHSKVRRAKLYFLRDRKGKGVRLPERRVHTPKKTGGSRKNKKRRGAKAKADA